MYAIKEVKKGYKMKENFEKEFVTEAEVIVRRIETGFYFQIRYKNVGNDFYNVGFGSYNIHNVFSWLDEYFVFVNSQDQETKSK